MVYLINCLTNSLYFGIPVLYYYANFNLSIISYLSLRDMYLFNVNINSSKLSKNMHTFQVLASIHQYFFVFLLEICIFFLGVPIYTSYSLSSFGNSLVYCFFETLLILSAILLPIKSPVASAVFELLFLMLFLLHLLQILQHYHEGFCHIYYLTFYQYFLQKIKIHIL